MFKLLKLTSQNTKIKHYVKDDKQRVTSEELQKKRVQNNLCFVENNS